MKKLILGLAVAAAAFAASAEYKTIEVINGSNDLQIAGAYLPVAIEVKSTSIGATVSVNRERDSVIYRKCYDVTTNEYPWTEVQITTNDYFTVTNRNARQEQVKARESGMTAGCRWTDEWFALNGYVYTNSNFNGTAFDSDFKAYGAGVYVDIVNGNLKYGDSPTNYSDAVSVPKYIYGGSEKNYSWNSCAYGNGVFIATGHETEFDHESEFVTAKSEDGMNWTKVDTNQVAGVAFVNGMFFSNERFLWSVAQPLRMSVNGETWVTSYDGEASIPQYVDGLYYSLVDGNIITSKTCRSWGVWKTGLGTTGYNHITATGLCYVNAWDAFLVPQVRYQESTVLGTQISVVTKDGTIYLYSGAVQYGTLMPTPNGYVASTESTGNSTYLYGPCEEKIYWHATGSVGQNETWTNCYDTYVVSTRLLGYKPNQWKDSAAVFDYDGYWKLELEGLTRYSKVNDQRPNRIVFDRKINNNENPDAPVLQPIAYLTYDRTTNYIPHVRYEYVTNRVWNVVDSMTRKSVKIVDANCTDGTYSGAVTSGVFVVNGDRIVVSGLIDDADNKTKATLICE